MYISFEYFNVRKWLGYREVKTSLDLEDSPSWSDLEHADNTGDYCIHRFLSYGDYNNSCMVEKSNVKSFLDDFDIDSVPVWEIFGSYGSHSILFNREWIEESNSETAEQMRDVLESLEDYPYYSEDDYSEMTWNSYFEEWDNYGMGDFIREITRKFNLNYDQQDILEGMTSESLQRIYETLLPSGEWYLDETPGGVTLLTSNAVKNLTYDDIDQILTLSQGIDITSLWCDLTASQDCLKWRIFNRIHDMKKVSELEKKVSELEASC